MCQIEKHDYYPGWPFSWKSYCKKCGYEPLFNDNYNPNPTYLDDHQLKHLLDNVQMELKFRETQAKTTSEII